MHWQDIVLGIGQILFSLALIPSIRSHHKPAVFTGLLTGTVLLVFSFVYLSLSLYFALAAAASNALLWFLLASEEWRMERKGARD